MVKFQGYKGIKRDKLKKTVFSIVLKRPSEATSRRKKQQKSILKRQKIPDLKWEKTQLLQLPGTKIILKYGCNYSN